MMLLEQKDHDLIAQHFIAAAERIGICDPRFQHPYMIVDESSQPRMTVEEMLYHGPRGIEPFSAMRVTLTTGTKKMTTHVYPHDRGRIDDLMALATSYLQDLLYDWEAHPYEVWHFIR